MANRLCVNCFADIPAEADSLCPHCGYDNRKAQASEALPYETLLDERYVIGRAKSMNGEGITYAAFDSSKRKIVEVREFFPVSISRREEDNSVHAMSGHEAAFSRYLSDFINLSKNVSRMKEISVVATINAIFEENLTAYVVYEYNQTISLRNYVTANGSMNWNQAHHVFQPILTALGLMNSLGISHLGISPETIRVTSDGSLLITGFCIPAIRHVGTPLIEELSPGAAALEQYSKNGVCSEITDVYGFGATLMFALCGQLPAEAPKRLRDERLMISKEHLADIPPYAISALANSLQVKQENRVSTFESLRAQFEAPTQSYTEAINTGAIRRLPSMESRSPQNRGLPPFVWLIGTCVITLVALIIIASVWLRDSNMSFDDIFALFTSEASSSVTAGVPDMLGESIDEWQERVASGRYSFKINVVANEFSSTVSQGNIISQNPMAGEPFPEDNTIVVTVSRGSAMRTLPEISGMTFVELSQVLEENGFIIIKEDQSSNDIALGSVIAYKDYAAGDSVEFGSQITLIVSTGPEE